MWQVDRPVCGTDGVTYANECEMRLASCQKQQFIVIQSEGSCGKPLILCPDLPSVWSCLSSLEIYDDLNWLAHGVVTWWLNSSIVSYPTAPLDMHHLTCGINSLLHSVNLIVFTLLLVHLILRILPHHRHHLRSHHLSLPRPFTPDLKLISFTNPFLHSHSYSFRTDFTDLDLYCIKGALALFVLVSFSGYVC